MIVAKSARPPIDQFRLLMIKTDEFLNSDAIEREDYYSDRNGVVLEEDVTRALTICSKNTPFEGKIERVSEGRFPDIVAAGYYGVEVKSTKENKWQSIGSSILESTREKDVERIFLTFGKLGKPIEFKSRPYEECLSGISVTHYPRYQINMELADGETIFDKMSVSYDQLRKMDNPAAPVISYYKGILKPGQSLWWVPDLSDEASVAPPVLRIWSSLSEDEKTQFTATGYALFPEIFAQRSSQQYYRYVLWLVKSHSIINPNVRDQFSAGGKVSAVINGVNESASAVFGKVGNFSRLIKLIILNTKEETLKRYWNVDCVRSDRISQWIDLVASYGATQKFDATKIKAYLQGIL